MIGPVGIKNLYFRKRRISFFFTLIVFVNVFKIICRHGKIKILVKLFKSFPVKLRKTLKRLYLLRLFKLHCKCFGNFLRGFSLIDGVNKIRLYLFNILLRKLPFNYVCDSCSDNRHIILLRIGKQRHALNSRISPLVKLTG